MDHVLFALEGYFYKDREILFIFPKFGFLLVSFGTAFGLLHKNQKKGKSRLGEVQKNSKFYSSNGDKKTAKILVSYSPHTVSILHPYSKEGVGRDWQTF